MADEQPPERNEAVEEVCVGADVAVRGALHERLIDRPVQQHPDAGRIGGTAQPLQCFPGGGFDLGSVFTAAVNDQPCPIVQDVWGDLCEFGHQLRK